MGEADHPRLVPRYDRAAPDALSETLALTAALESLEVQNTRWWCPLDSQVGL